MTYTMTLLTVLIWTAETIVRIAHRHDATVDAESHAIHKKKHTTEVCTTHNLEIIPLSNVRTRHHKRPIRSRLQCWTRSSDQCRTCSRTAGVADYLMTDCSE